MIGIFDSGLGGLTVARAIMATLPGYDIVYFGDTARTPYGPKSRETVARYAVENTHFLMENGAKIVVIACNSASSVATDQVIGKFTIPLFEVITPAAEFSVSVSTKNRIGVIGTRATINSGIYEEKIRNLNPAVRVYSAACPLLVPLVEEGWLKKPETRMIVKKYLIPLKARQIDTLILGCTHYPLLKEIIQRKIGKRVNVIDSSLAVAANVKAYLDQHPETDAGLSRNGKASFFVSDVTDHFEAIANSVLKQKISLNHVLL